MEVVYKAVHKNMSCTMGKGVFMYPNGEWIEETEANVGQNGLHACLNVLDCLDYYTNLNEDRYYMALADGDISEDGINTRISCTRLKLLRELDLEGIVTHASYFIMKHPQLKITSRYYSEEKGVALNKFIIVRGEHPVASGTKEGQKLVLLKHNSKREIEAMNIIEIDGKVYKPGAWYGIQGEEVII